MSHQYYKPTKSRLHRSELAVPGSSPKMFDKAINKYKIIPVKILNELLITMKKGCLCALCGAIPVPIMNILKYFSDEMKDDIVQEN